MPKKPSTSYIQYATIMVKKIAEEQKVSHMEAMKKCGA
jgi:hypothetical protein